MEAREHKIRLAVARLRAERELRETRQIGPRAAWNPRLHPRDRLQRFRDVYARDDEPNTPAAVAGDLVTHLDKISKPYDLSDEHDRSIVRGQFFDSLANMRAMWIAKAADAFGGRKGTKQENMRVIVDGYIADRAQEVPEDAEVVEPEVVKPGALVPFVPAPEPPKPLGEPKRHSVLHADTKDPTIKRIMAAVEPHLPIRQTHRNVQIIGQDRLVLRGTQWSGGYRTTYTAVDMATFEVKPLPRFGDDFHLAEPTIDIPPGLAVVAFNQAGDRSYTHIYAHPDSLTRMVAAPGDAPSEDEALVLIYKAALKNSYGGEKNVQFTTASRKHGITRERWDAATRSLIDRKLLTKAGAITQGGRNAVENHPLRRSP